MYTSSVLQRTVIEPEPVQEILLKKQIPSFTASLIRRRPKIWNLEKSLHCPIIGLCLPDNDLERLAKRFCFESPLDNLHELHVEATCAVARKNGFSEAVHKLLDRLHRDYIEQFNPAKTDDDVMSLWEKCFVSGKIAGPLWAALTHKWMSEKNRERIHETLHMYMHKAALDLVVAQERMMESKRLLEEMTARAEQLKQQHAHTEARLQHLLQQAQSEIITLQQSHQEAEILRERLAQLESGQAMTQMAKRIAQFKIEINQLQTRCAAFDRLKASLKTACHNLAELYRERDAWYQERNVLESLMLNNEAQRPADSPADATPIIDDTTSGTNVLCVGGKSSLLPHYRALARQFGLAFLHHDGGQEDALSRLPDMIYRAQSVMCPTDCVSHAAYYQVKRLCGKNRTPCLLFKGMGVSSFAAALAKIAAGETSMI